MATRTKPKDIVDASQTVYGVFKKLLMWIWIPLTIFTVVAVIIWSTNDLHREGNMVEQQRGAARSGLEIPLASSAKSEWPSITLPPHGKSQLVPFKAGGHINTTKEAFLMYVKYVDGRECEVTQGCPDGAIQGFYLVNTSARTIVVSYAFEPA